jgi:hypothetical protein
VLKSEEGFHAATFWGPFSFAVRSPGLYIRRDGSEAQLQQLFGFLVGLIFCIELFKTRLNKVGKLRSRFVIEGELYILTSSFDRDRLNTLT